MYDRLGEVERQHNNAYKKNPYGVTLHPRDTEWLIEQAKKAEQYKKANEPRPIEEWGEDYGDCLWWSFPIIEPPYCGTPLDGDFPEYVTHFTRLTLPIESKD